MNSYAPQANACISVVRESYSRIVRSALVRAGGIEQLLDSAAQTLLIDLGVGDPSDDSNGIGAANSASAAAAIPSPIDGSGTGTPSRVVTPRRRAVSARTTSRAPATPAARKGVAAAARPSQLASLTAAPPLRPEGSLVCPWFTDTGGTIEEAESKAVE